MIDKYDLVLFSFILLVIIICFIFIKLNEVF